MIKDILLFLWIFILPIFFYLLEKTKISKKFLLSEQKDFAEMRSCFVGLCFFIIILSIFMFIHLPIQIAIVFLCLTEIVIFDFFCIFSEFTYSLKHRHWGKLFLSIIFFFFFSSHASICIVMMVNDMKNLNFLVNLLMLFVIFTYPLTSWYQCKRMKVLFNQQRRGQK